MAKNLIQRMKSGGQIQPSDVPQYQPIQMFEPAGKWETALDIYNKQFDPELELARDSLDLKRKEARDAKELAQDTLSLETRKLQETILSDKRKDSQAKRESDFDIYSSAVEGLPFSMAASVAQGMELDELADINTDLAGKVSDANQAFNNAVANNNYKEANKVFSDNSILFSRHNIDYKAKENELQGMYAKSILPSLLSIDGIKNSLGDELYNRWSSPEISNAGALNAFKSFVPTLSIARGANEDNIKSLQTFLELVPSLYEGAVDANSQALIDNLNEKVVPAINKLTESAFRTGPPDKPEPPPEPPAKVEEKKSLAKRIGFEAPTPEALQSIPKKDLSKIKSSPLWKKENYTIPGPNNRKMYYSRKAKQTLSKILNRNVGDKEALLVYKTLETSGGRASSLIGEAYASQGISPQSIESRIASEIGSALNLGKGVLPAEASMAIPISGAYAGQSSDIEEVSSLLDKYSNITPD